MKNSYLTRRSGILFALAVALLLLLIWAVPFLYTRLVILPREYPALAPGDVNLIGIRLEGERIVVSHGIARLQQAGEEGFGAGAAVEGMVVPMRGLIGALRGDAEAATELVESMSRLTREIEPTPDIIWEREDVIAALGNDEELRARLERDLVTALDGSGIERITRSRVFTGIYIRMPVPVKTPSSAGGEVLAQPLVPYRTQLAQGVEQHRLIRESAYDDATIAGVYAEIAEEMERSGRQEDVAEALRAITSEERIRRMAAPAEHLLARVSVLVTENEITGASLSERPRPEGEGMLYTMRLELTEPGRDRLWQYTHLNPRTQLLFVVEGIAIAAPFVQHEMKYSTARISNIVDEELARGALDFIQRDSREQ